MLQKQWDTYHYYFEVLGLEASHLLSQQFLELFFENDSYLSTAPVLSHSNGPFQPYPLLLKRGDLKGKRDSKKNMKNSFWSASFKPSKWPIQAFRKTTDCLF